MLLKITQKCQQKNNGQRHTPRIPKILLLPACLYKLEKETLLYLQQSKEVEETEPRPALTINEDTPKHYFEIFSNLEPLHVKKPKYKIIKYGQYWWFYPKHNVGGNFYCMYMKHP